MIDWNELTNDGDGFDAERALAQLEAALEVRPLLELLAESVTIDHTLATLANAPTTTLLGLLEESTVAQAAALVHPDWPEGKQGSYVDALVAMATAALDIGHLNAFYD